MKNKELRASILGAGYISSYHVEAIARRSDAQLVAVCDMNEQAARRLVGERSGVEVFTDYSEMLSRAKPDVVHVLTQPDSHCVLTRMALEAGCDTIVEKPVTTSSAQARELSEIADANNRRVAINHNFVFSRPFNDLVAAIQAGHLGPLKSIRVVWKKTLPQLTSGPWNLWMLRDPINILFETGSHSLSELLAVIGEPPVVTHVSARMPKVLPSGTVFYRRWGIAAQCGQISVQIDTAFDHGYQQHFVEVEGLFGVARADIEEDVFTADLPTGRMYDAERFHANLGAGLSRTRQAVRTYAAYAASKLTKAATGNPYEASMLNGIANCYAEIRGEAKRVESSIGYAIGIAETAEEIASKLPHEKTKQASPASLPGPAEKPTADASVLIVGATGFIGRRLLVALQKAGVGVRALVRNPSNLVGIELNDHSEVIVGDFRNSDLMDQALQGIETVFHLAVAHGKSLSDYVQIDTEPTVDFAKLCQRKGVRRFIYTGTIDSLDLARSHRLNEVDGVDENLARRNNYAHSKALTEQRLLQLHKDEEFPVVIVRPAIVLGAGGPVDHVGVANWFGIGRCSFWGDGRNLIPAVLVDDVVSGLIKAMDTPDIEGRTYNLSAEPCVSARDYVAEVENVLNSKIATSTSSAYAHFAGDIFKWGVKVLARHPDKQRIPSVHDWKCREQHASFDTNAAQRDLNWQPVNDRDEIIEKGIREPARLYLEG